MDKILVTSSGLFIILFIIWFFFGKKETESQTHEGKIEILVEGGYKPDTIKIPLNQKVKLIFFRKDPSSCLEEIVIPDFKIRKYLNINKQNEVDFTANKRGVFPFTCGMNMYHGKIIVF